MTGLVCGSDQEDPPVQFSRFQPNSIDSSTKDIFAISHSQDKELIFFARERESGVKNEKTGTLQSWVAFFVFFFFHFAFKAPSAVVDSCQGGQHCQVLRNILVFISILGRISSLFAQAEKYVQSHTCSQKLS